jgi:serine protease SohB
MNKSYYAVIWLVLMIGQALPGPQTSFWPFNKDASNTANNNDNGIVKKQPPMSPRTVEMRSDMYGHEKQFAKKAHTMMDGSSIAEQGLLMTLLFGSSSSNDPTPADDSPNYAFPVNTGIPKVQSITLTHLNREYEGYRYSVRAAVTTKVQASREYAQTSFRRVLEKVLARLAYSSSSSFDDRRKLTILEERFLDQTAGLLDQLGTWRALLVPDDDQQNATHGAGGAGRIRPRCNNTNFTATPSTTSTLPPFMLQSTPRSSRRELMVPLPPPPPNAPLPQQCAYNRTMVVPSNSNSSTANTTSTTEHMVLMLNSTTNTTTNTTTTTTTTTVREEIKKMESKLTALTNTFLEQIGDSLTPGPAQMLRDALTGHGAMWNAEGLVRDLQTTPMRTLLNDAQRRRRLFVTYFYGDILASTVAVLRREVTAMVRSATPGADEVLVVLQSGGGTVTGYGLVAAQLLRLKAAGLTLTVAVEQVAASGGYMAACVGDTIVCSPFAVVGSIGVIQEMPNVHERLKREGIEFHQVTAGQYKRVLSPTKEVTPEDLQKTKEDIDEVWTLFKDFVSEQRPSLKMDTVATGEVWYGKRAVELGLCDALQAADDVLIDFMDRGYDVYQVKYEEPVPDFWEQLTGKATATGAGSGGSGLLHWFVQRMVALLHAELGKMAGIGIDDNNNHRPMLLV